MALLLVHPRPAHGVPARRSHRARAAGHSGPYRPVLNRRNRVCVQHRHASLRCAQRWSNVDIDVEDSISIDHQEEGILWLNTSCPNWITTTGRWNHTYPGRSTSYTTANTTRHM